MTTYHPSNQDDKQKSQIIGGGDLVGDFIEDVWKVMTPEMMERLKCILTEDWGLSKTDTNKFIQCQRDNRRQRICLKKTTREVKIGPRNQWIKELSKYIADHIANFMVGILLSDRNYRSKKLTDQVLDQLCEATGENTTVDSAKTRVERILVVVADRLACWIDENMSDIELRLKEQLSASLETQSKETVASFEPFESRTESEDFSSDFTLTLSEDTEKSKQSLITFISDEGGDIKEDEPSEDEEEYDERDVSSAHESSQPSDSSDEELEEPSDKSDSGEESESIQESEDETSEDEEEESVNDEDSEEEETNEDEGEEDETESGSEDESESEEESMKSGSVVDEAKAEKIVEEEKEISKESETVLSETQEEFITKSVLSKDKDLTIDILDLLKEDLSRLPKTDKKTDRQKAIKEVIDKRLKAMAKEKLEGSLDSIIKYDIDETASIVANWVDKILSTADGVNALIQNAPKQGSAFEIIREDGSQLRVQKLSSATVATKVAALRGLDPPLRKKKIPRTMSPMNIKSMNDWADWAIGATNMGKEWDKWLDDTIEEVEHQLVRPRVSESKVEKYAAWKDWRAKKGLEAIKWRAEKQRIKAEGALWNKKLQSGLNQTPEQETKQVTY